MKKIELGLDYDLSNLTGLCFNFLYWGNSTHDTLDNSEKGPFALALQSNLYNTLRAR